MSAVLDHPGEPAAAAPKPMSPWQRAWARVRRHRLGYVSLWVFGLMLVLATGAELL